MRREHAEEQAKGRVPEEPECDVYDVKVCYVGC
jgi:hypothetical protein